MPQDLIAQLQLAFVLSLLAAAVLVASKFTAAEYRLKLGVYAVIFNLLTVVLEMFLPRPFNRLVVYSNPVMMFFYGFFHAIAKALVVHEVVSGFVAALGAMIAILASSSGAWLLIGRIVGGQVDNYRPPGE